MQQTIEPQIRNWAMGAHLSALVAFGMPMGHIIGPLVVYLVKGNESEFVAEHAKASLNYQITLSIFAIIGVVVALAVLFGFGVTTNGSENNTLPAGFVAFLIAVVAVVLLAIFGSIAFIIVATIAANEGRRYTYPFAIRFIR